MHCSTVVVVLVGLLLGTVPFAVAQSRVAGPKSPIFGCVFGGYPVNGGCCKTGNCFVPQGNCYCDVACHFFGDCCFDILAISCGGCIDQGFPPFGGCCKRNCKSSRGKCYCDKACYFFRDCCEDIAWIGCYNWPPVTSQLAKAARQRG